MKVRTYSRKKKSTLSSGNSAGKSSIFGRKNVHSGIEWDENDSGTANKNVWEAKPKKKKAGLFDSDDDDFELSEASYSSDIANEGANNEENFAVDDLEKVDEHNEENSVVNDNEKENGNDELNHIQFSEKMDSLSFDDSKEVEQNAERKSNSTSNVGTDIEHGDEIEVLPTMKKDEIETMNATNTLLQQETEKKGQNCGNITTEDDSDLDIPDICERLEEIKMPTPLKQFSNFPTSSPHPLKDSHQISSADGAKEYEDIDEICKILDEDLSINPINKRRSKHRLRRRSSILHMDKIHLESKRNMRRLSISDINLNLHQDHSYRKKKERERFRMSILPQLDEEEEENQLVECDGVVQTLNSSEVIGETKPSSCFSVENEALILAMVLEYIDRHTLLGTVCKVNRQWYKLGCTAYNYSTSEVINTRCRNLEQHLEEKGTFSDLDDAVLSGVWSCKDKLGSAFPTGKFIAEGSFKKVFKVWFEPKGRYEAVSVMDLLGIAELGQASIVAQEISVSLMISELVTNSVSPCPFFIETYQVFELSHPPPLEIWSSPNSQMELCQGGDLEEFTKTIYHDMLELSDVRSVIFQMLFAIHIGQKELSLRHYDIKLLNYFVKLVKYDKTKSEGIQVQFRGSTFSLPKMNSKYKVVEENDEDDGDSDSILVVKLADYGTADISLDTMDKPIQPCHFTTLENAPIDYLLFVDAKQSYSADAFDVGLCVLHLFTGGLPYEEILETVTAPNPLKKVLKSIWMTRSRGYNVVRDVLVEMDNDVVYDTLYRYIVLFGFPNSVEKVSSMRKKSAIWNELCKYLVDPMENKRRIAADVITVREQYRQDCQRFSLKEGTNELIERARHRLDESQGGWRILNKLVDFDPQSRASVEELLKDGYFDALKVEEIA